MAQVDDGIELKFRIFDGTDIGEGIYAPSTSVSALKQRLLSEWPQDKSVLPKSVNDMKLIHSGKVLENGKTLGECIAHIIELPGVIITMHVVVQPPIAKKKSDKNLSEKQKQGSCACTIL